MLNKGAPKVISNSAQERAEAIKLELFSLPGSPVSTSANLGKLVNLPEELCYLLL